jgi:hypothetical protein
LFDIRSSTPFSSLFDPSAKSARRIKTDESMQIYALFVSLISHQPAVLFSQNKPAAVISHQPNE